MEVLFHEDEAYWREDFEKAKKSRDLMQKQI